MTTTFKIVLKPIWILSLLLLAGSFSITFPAYGQSDGEQIIQVVPNRVTVSELKLRGRIQSQFANSFGSNSNLIEEAGEYSSFEMRRARLGVQGKLYGNWDFMLEANVLSSVNLDAATLTYSALPIANITFGKAKPRFGHEQNTSSASILTFERTLLDGLLNGGKPLGLRVHGSSGAFSYYLGVYNGESVNTSRMGSELDTYLYNASAGLDVASLTGMSERGITARFRADMLYRGDQDGGYYPYEDSYALSAHFGYDVIDLRTEYMTGNRIDDNRVEGFYLMPSWYVVPGRLQLVARYERVSADNGLALGQNRYADRVPQLYGAGSRYSAVYGGVNYRIYGDNLKLMAGLEIAENNGDESAIGRVTTLFTGFRMQF